MIFCYRNALLIETVRKLSHHYMDSGYPVLAACCYLSYDMIDVSLSAKVCVS